MNRTIMLIEDNPQNQYLATYLLERRGYTVLLAPDGIAAMEIVEQTLPVAILLDIHMPVMDGYQVARALRESPGLARVPIIAVTAYAMAGDRERALASGCDGYIEKPIDPDTFIAQIEEFLPCKPSEQER